MQIFLCYNRKNVNPIVIVEYIKTFMDKFNLILIEFIDDNIVCNNNDNKYIFIQTIPEKFMNNKNVILLSIEQMTNLNFKKMVQETLKKGIKVIDYSQVNIKLVNSDIPINYLPYQYNEREVTKLSCPLPKIYDVVFVGWMCDRRNKICEQLINSGLSVKIIGDDWGSFRDDIIRTGKLLLNIHYSEDYNVYEEIRCNRWTFAKMPIISENSLFDYMLDISPLVVFTHYDNLVNKTIEIIKNYDEYKKIFDIRYDKLIDEIKKNRSMGYNQFLNMI